MMEKKVEERKYRKCPHCKSNKGAIVTIALGGYQYEHVNFSGKQLEIDRQGTDTIEKFASCIDCGKNIQMDKLKYQH